MTTANKILVALIAALFILSAYVAIELTQYISTVKAAAAAAGSDMAIVQFYPWLAIGFAI